MADKFNLLSRRIMADRRQWEQERNRLVSAVRSISDAVVLLNSSGRVMFANPEALGRLGLPDGVTVGKNIANLLGRDHPLVRLAGTALSGSITTSPTPATSAPSTRPRSCKPWP